MNRQWIDNGQTIDRKWIDNIIQGIDNGYILNRQWTINRRLMNNGQKWDIHEEGMKNTLTRDND